MSAKKTSLFSISIFLFFACSAQTKQGVEFLQAKDFSIRMDSSKDAVILDVRTPEEFAKNRLANAVNFNWLDTDFEKNVSQIDKTSPVFVYCFSGARSKAAAEKMAVLGFTKVYALEGGLLKWEAAKLPEIKTALSSEGMSKAEFDKLILPGKTVLVDFYADWCAPCKEMEPFIHEIATENANNLVVLRINIDENPALADSLKVYAIPYLQVYKNQKLTWEKEGFTGKKDIQKHL